jgi:hypothetical protein
MMALTRIQGCDFRNIEKVILFKVPATLPTGLPRGGRGGRNENIWCRVVLWLKRPNESQDL